MEACKNGTNKLLYPDLLPIQTFLEWNGEDKPKVSCNMWLSHENGKFDVRKLEIERKDQYGHSMKKLELKVLSTETLPTRKEAIALVSDKPTQELPSRNRQFKMR
ncbi:hypothetical protein [Sphingobacterium bovisgrunnientis]|uniref:hypothetical protein n=1 Tax=Sphingobacterium bovisgrunnientis TaxID=1874697 RepID=UPI001F03315E|nr:hypothetical protein [Sphingobacterium bovisgrunnientis]